MEKNKPEKENRECCGGVSQLQFWKDWLVKASLEKSRPAKDKAGERTPHGVCPWKSISGRGSSKYRGPTRELKCAGYQPRPVCLVLGSGQRGAWWKNASEKGQEVLDRGIRRLVLGSYLKYFGCDLLVA